LPFPIGDVATQVAWGAVRSGERGHWPLRNADLDLTHVEPACVRWGVVELDPPQKKPKPPARLSWLRGRERLIQGSGGWSISYPAQPGWSCHRIMDVDCIVATNLMRTLSCSSRWQSRGRSCIGRNLLALAAQVTLIAATGTIHFERTKRLMFPLRRDSES